jgi:HEPN domain-containing protein
MANTNNKYVQNWFKSANYDILTAKAMLRSKRYIYVIFMCHLAIEKLLKGIVAQKINKIPPKTHDLYLLLKLSKIQIPSLHQEIISHLNEASIPTRYPEDISKISKQYNKKVAINYLKATEGLLKWLKINIR